MSAENLLFQMNNPNHSNEWFDFDNSFEFPSAYLDSDPSSVNSISPKDYDLTYSETGELNWIPTPEFCAQPLFSEFVNEENSFEGYAGNEFDSIGPLPDINYKFDQTPNPTQTSFEATIDQSLLPVFQEAQQPIHFTSSVKHMVEAQAATDTRCSSKKEKRREAGIAVHLQRLYEAATELEIPSDSNTSFSSPSWSDVQGSVSPGSMRVSPTATPASSDSTEPNYTPGSSGGESGSARELVFDLNLNATSELPKKQKPRSQAQKDNYIKARKYGACEKHRKQHKRCNCLEKNLARIDVNETAILASNTLTGLSRQPDIQLHTHQPKQPLVQSKECSRGITDSQTTNQGRDLVDRHTCHPPGRLTPSRAQEDHTNIQHSLHPVSEPAAAVSVIRLKQQPLDRNRTTRPWPSSDQVQTVPGTVQIQHTKQSVLPSGDIDHTQRSVHTVPRSHDGTYRIPPTSSISQSQSVNHDQKVTGRQSTKPDKNSMLQPSKSINNVSPQCSTKHGPKPTNRSIIESAYGTLQETMLSISSFWQSSTNISSWVGTYIGKIVFGSCKCGLLAQKGLGLQWSSI